MKGVTLIFWTLVISLLISTGISAQIQTYEEMIRIEIIKRGIDESAFQLALLEEGIDYSNLDALSAADIEKIRIVLRELELKSANSPELLVESIFSDSMEVSVDTMLDSIQVIEIEGLDTLGVAIYGHQFFRNGQVTIIEEEDGFVPPMDYVIGIGDELSVGIYGASRLNENFVLGSDGSISIYPNLNNPQGNERIFLGGMKLSQAREKLIQDFQKFYRFSPTQFTLGVSAVRRIRIQVNGEVNNPGEFNVSGLNGISNLIAAAGGFTDIGGVRHIKVNKRDGRTLTFDLYKWLTSVDYKSSFGLDNGDFIFVPAAQNVVSIDGAIKRPHNYELIKSEGIIDLVTYAGGLDKGAFLTAFDLVRYEGDRKVYKQIPYAQLIKNRKGFELKNGDEITIDRIDETLESYVSVLGEVRNSGRFEFDVTMSIKELLLLATPLPTARLDAAYLRRTNNDGTTSIQSISINEILNGEGTSLSIELQDKDEIEVWALERFEENKEVKIAGAVKESVSIPYDQGGNLRVSDLIVMAGGLKRNARSYAHVHRLDPMNPQELQYVRVDLERVLDNPSAADNIVLSPFDSIHVYDKDEFLDNLTFEVKGAVNNPGQFLYGEGMSVRDAIALAGEFKLSAATNDIEISRVIIRDNEPTRTTIQKVSLSRLEAKDFSSKAGGFQLEPFDIVHVRYVPQFELQQNVIITGEVTLPGEYSLERDNERVFDIIKRAGGLTAEAFPASATMQRTDQDLGELVMRLDEVMDDPSSKFNYTLRNGDSLYIPKIQDYVVIEGEAQYLVQNGQKKKVTPYEVGEDALFYIERYVGGFGENAVKDKIFVTYPNGEVRKTEKRFPFGKKHPEVVPGAIIQIAKKKTEIKNEQGDQNVNWTKVLGDSVAQAASILTLLLLIQRLD